MPITPNTFVQLSMGISVSPLVMDIYPLTSDTIAAAGTAVAMTEFTNGKGTYRSAAFDGTGLYGEFRAKFRIGASIYVDTFVILSGNDGLIHQAGIDPVLHRWLRTMCRTNNIDTVALAEINLNNGTFNPVTQDSLQAIGSNADLVGPGATACELLITDPSNVPSPQAEVWLTSDPSGTTVVAGTLLTDSNGLVTFMLTVGNTYYLWVRKDGFNSVQGIPYVASAG